MSAGDKFQRLADIMARLRGPNGCPWDREQTFDTIKPYLLEEAYEAVDAIDAGDWPALAEELGDLLLEVVFLAQIARDENHFEIESSLDLINGKLVRRHPHVFGSGTAKTAEDVKQSWDEIKAQERNEKPARAGGLLASVPRAQPALMEATQIATRAARAGFDWDTTDQVLEKLTEELEELQQARAEPNKSQIEHELGDLLFTLVNVARFLEIDPEQALRGTNARFRERFGYVEQRLGDSGKSPSTATLEEMEALWQEAKRNP